jgi:trimethylamine:corrinoid methyltransferase-like protein
MSEASRPKSGLTCKRGFTKKQNQTMDRIIELKVGGKLFTTAMSTLTMKSDYFKAMFDSGMWKESFESGKPTFIDRGNHVQLSSTIV